MNATIYDDDIDFEKPRIYWIGAKPDGSVNQASIRRYVDGGGLVPDYTEPMEVLSGNPDTHRWEVFDAKPKKPYVRCGPFSSHGIATVAADQLNTGKTTTK